MPDFGDGMPYADEIPWRMSRRNPNDPPIVTALPEGLDLESLYVQHMIEADDLIAHLRESERVYREILQASFDTLNKQRAYIVTLNRRIEELSGRRTS